MAAMVRLQKQIDGIVEESYLLKNEAEEQRTLEYLAARRIQAWFRGTRSRSYLKFLNRCATNVQRAWRGFLGRRYFRILVKNSVFIMKLNFYNTMAWKIQKVWRGYYVRKYISNYYSRKRYLEALQVKNEIFRTELTEFAEQQAQIRERIAEQALRKQQELSAFKTHYLVSTEVIPGIYNSPYQPYPSDEELLLRSVKPVIRRKKKQTDGYMFDPAWLSYNQPRPDSLPPLNNKPQGPFREPQEVQNQRYKPFQPSLRVSTSFYSLEKARDEMKAEEWVTRLIDDKFIPFSKLEKPYQRLLYTTSKFGHLPYGSKYFREEQADKHVTPKSFKTIVPPIPIFSKLNDTYSQGQV
ncbi:spermatogenesis-associated protein 17-like [Gigantopelta aegis]|uniref:spermatogenesis-associated protein 17-like n=1 Tax=Gigantopelta aegis TaxID=1735272 RepID=UPI001B888514|nr:spermatogenesis-associated protein 17-like [Gigantopelta aegis]